MGTSLTGLTPATTYDALIKVGDNGPIDATLKVLSDGLGNNLPMEASSTTINFTNQLQQSGVAVPTASQVNAKQDTLVSGTNIKTINGTSVLGAGNIVTPTTSPSGVSGAIQFSNGSAFASDASNFFWDNTNKRLGIGTTSPATALDIRVNNSINGVLSVVNSNDSSNYGARIQLYDKNSGSPIVDGANGLAIIYTDSVNTGYLWNYNNGPLLFGTNGSERMRLVNGGGVIIKGSGSTSATTSLLVQNSGGTESFKVQDNGNATVANRLNLLDNNNSFEAPSGSQITANAYHGFRVIRGTGVGSTMFEVFDNSITPSGLLVNVKNSSFSNMFAINYIGQASMGTASPNASAQFQIDSTTKGFLPPRMTTTQKNAIASPAAGLVVYDTTTNKLQCYNGSTWNDLF